VPFRSAHPPVGARLRRRAAATPNRRPKQRGPPSPRTHELAGHGRYSKQTPGAGATAVGRGPESSRHRFSKQTGGGLPPRRASAAQASRACSEAPRGSCHQTICFPRLSHAVERLAAERRRRRRRPSPAAGFDGCCATRSRPLDGAAAEGTSVSRSSPTVFEAQGGQPTTARTGIEGARPEGDRRARSIFGARQRSRRHEAPAEPRGLPPPPTEAAGRGPSAEACLDGSGPSGLLGSTTSHHGPINLFSSAISSR
jgi:hypothetical protein